MQTFLLRRKKDSMLDGKQLIELLEKEVKLIFGGRTRDLPDGRSS